MTQIHWAAQINGAFNTAADWSTGTVPGPVDDAILDAPGATNYTVSATTSETVNSVQLASTATLAIDAKGFLAVNGTGSGANAGLIQINSGASFTTGGAVVNSGRIDIHSAGAATSLDVEAGGLTLSGHGALTLSGATSEILGTGSVPPKLTNVDNTISGQGAIGGGKLDIVNEAAGVIDGTGATQALIVNVKTLTNTGLLEGTGAGGLELHLAKVTNIGGVISAANGSKVILSQSSVIGGTLETAGTGVIEVTGAGNLLHGASGGIVNNGAVDVANNASLTLKGTISNKGTISLSGAANVSNLIVGGTGASLTGGGKVLLSNSTQDRFYGAATTATLTNVNNTITGAGLLGNGAMSLTNDASGSIVGAGAGTLTVDTGANAITNIGLIASDTSSDVVVKSTLVNSGTLSAAGGTLTLDGAVVGSGVATINGGTLDAANAFSENVTFTGSTGVLELAKSQSYTGSVTGLSLTGASSLDLGDIGFVSGTTTATYVDNGHGTGGVLTVTDGTATSKITLVGNYTASTFTASSDGHGGTTVVDPTTATLFSQAMASFAPASAANDAWQPSTHPTAALSLVSAHG